MSVETDSAEIICHRGMLTVREVVRGDDGARFGFPDDVTPDAGPCRVGRHG
ncbi:hypothetical protein G7085_09215 [Tessaracoccus sp. HDW20]|uniref:hypothetical protein n=1 Tax=Tessaracoccus coleopterorum TaxID=2714950 RepID=UPI0018D4411D|nr:hypothetical protein [Tessaracoccus coleopterorum]